MHMRPRAVQFSRLGDVDVLEVADIDVPSPGRGEVVVEVVSSAINHMETLLLRGEFAEELPVQFPQREGSDFAGRVLSVGAGVSTITPGMNVLGGVNRQAHATHVVVPAENVIPKPRHVPWEVAGALYLAGITAYNMVRSINVGAGETVVITAAAGGVGTIETSLARLHGARIIGTCSEKNADYLRNVGVVPVVYGDNLADRIREAGNGDNVVAYIDNSGGTNIEIAKELGVLDHRIRSLADRREVEVVAAKAEPDPSRTHTLSYLARLLDEHAMSIPISGFYPLEHVADAFVDLDRLRARGKVVLGTQPVHYKYQRVAPAGIIIRDMEK